jgi:hypothetical protein
MKNEDGTQGNQRAGEKAHFTFSVILLLFFFVVLFARIKD